MGKKEVRVNGIPVRYTEYNQGDSPIIIMHCAGGNDEFTKSHAEYLANLGYHVLNVSLRGHGKDNFDVSPSSKVEEFADDICGLIQHFGFKQVALVGLFYGGNIAVEVAHRIPSIVSHIILLNTPILMRPWARYAMIHYAQGLKDNIEDFLELLVYSTAVGLDADKARSIINAYSSVPNHILGSIYENIVKWDNTSREKLIKCEMPILFIESQELAYAKRDFKEICPHLVTGRIVGSTIWISLEAPDQINSMLKRFFEISKLNPIISKRIEVV